ncbi:hypothetical protein N7528_009426 [Penicillium herquei]|nr:hypothetical protein N7528_009426 [Penicillium herquei]
MEDNSDRDDSCNGSDTLWNVCVLCQRRKPAKHLQNIDQAYEYFGVLKHHDLDQIQSYESEPDSDEDGTFYDISSKPMFLAHDLFDGGLATGIKYILCACVEDRNQHPDPHHPPIAQAPSSESIMNMFDLDNAQKAPSRSGILEANFANAVDSNLDPFLLLPRELRLGIAQYLPTADFLNLRLSSKAMVSIFDSQVFWKTRFCLFSDLGLLDFLEGAKCTDWRLLYRSIKTHQLWRKSRVLNDLWEQWIHNQMIRDMYMMTEAPGLVPLAENTRSPGLQWTVTQAAQQGFFDEDPPKIDGCLRHFYRFGFYKTNDNCGKCLLLKHARHSQRITLRGRVVAVAVSVFTDVYATSITGLDFIYGYDDSEQVTSLGYRIPGKRIIFDLYGETLTGFDMRIEKGIGLLAIRPITTNSDIHYNWAGLAHGQGLSRPKIFALHFEQLDAESEVLAIYGTFDVSNLLEIIISNSMFTELSADGANNGLDRITR